jgi:hypothetical protein
MTQIGQDTQTVHLLNAKGKALCKADSPTGIAASDWAAGFTPAGLGTRICRNCETKAGTAAVFEPGEREAEHPTMPELADAEDMGR